MRDGGAIIERRLVSILVEVVCVCGSNEIEEE